MSTKASIKIKIDEPVAPLHAEKPGEVSHGTATFLTNGRFATALHVIRDKNKNYYPTFALSVKSFPGRERNIVLRTVLPGGRTGIFKILNPVKIIRETVQAGKGVLILQQEGKGVKIVPVNAAKKRPTFSFKKGDIFVWAADRDSSLQVMGVNSPPCSVCIKEGETTSLNENHPELSAQFRARIRELSPKTHSPSELAHTPQGKWSGARLSETGFVQKTETTRLPPETKTTKNSKRDGQKRKKPTGSK